MILSRSLIILCERDTLNPPSCDIRFARGDDLVFLTLWGLNHFTDTINQRLYRSIHIRIGKNSGVSNLRLNECSIWRNSCVNEKRVYRRLKLFNSGCLRLDFIKWPIQYSCTKMLLSNFIPYIKKLCKRRCIKTSCCNEAFLNLPVYQCLYQNWLIPSLVMMG